MFEYGKQLISSVRERAVATHADAKEWIWLHQVWLELSAGTLVIVDAFFCQQRAYLVLMPRTAPVLHPGHGRLGILEDVLCSNAQKVVAVDRDMAPSTVASHAKACLSFLGLGCNPSRVPPLVQQAARAARDHSLDRRVTSSRWLEGTSTYLTISAPRAECGLRRTLSEAEFEVVSALVEGFSHTEIARKRGTSPRTIANQLATAFRRLGVSSRGELLQRLSECAHLVESAPQSDQNTKAA